MLNDWKTIPPKNWQNYRKTLHHDQQRSEILTYFALKAWFTCVMFIQLVDTCCRAKEVDLDLIKYVWSKKVFVLCKHFCLVHPLMQSSALAWEQMIFLRTEFIIRESYNGIYSFQSGFNVCTFHVIWIKM